MLSDESSDDLGLPKEILERERQLFERNKQLESRLQELLRSTSLEVDIPKQKGPKSMNEIKKLDIDEFIVNLNNDKFIEVEIPNHVEAVTETIVDPVPELREVLHKITNEITNVSSQVSEIQKVRTEAEVQFSKMQTDIKRNQNEGEKISLEIIELNSSIESYKEKVVELKNQVNSTRLSKLEKIHSQGEASKKKLDVEKKIKKQKLAVERIHNEYKSMPLVDTKINELSNEKKGLSKKIDSQKKTLKHLKGLMSDISKAINAEIKIFDHLQYPLSYPMSPDTVIKTMSDSVLPN